MDTARAGTWSTLPIQAEGEDSTEPHQVIPRSSRWNRRWTGLCKMSSCHIGIQGDKDAYYGSIGPECTIRLCIHHVNKQTTGVSPLPAQQNEPNASRIPCRSSAYYVQIGYFETPVCCSGTPVAVVMKLTRAAQRHALAAKTAFRMPYEVVGGLLRN